MTIDRTLVSVVIPIHNAGKYLGRTRNQLAALDTSVDYEFVLINDHSIDDSDTQIEKWAEYLSGEVTILQANRRGVAAARNQALAACTGTYIWLADADDAWDPRIVSDMVATAEENAADVVVCNAVKRTPDGENVGSIEDATNARVFNGREALIRLLDGRLQGHLWNKLFARHLLADDPFPEIRAHSDLGGMLRVLPRAQRVAALPSELYVYVQNANSILNSKAYDFGDLRRCLELAQEETESVGLSQEERYALLRFRYHNIIVPSLNEIARRARNIDPALRRSESRKIKRSIRWTDLIALAGAGHRRLALQAAIANISPGAYNRIYRTATGRLRRTTAISGRN